MKETDNSGHLRCHGPDASLMDIKAFSVIAHAVDIDDGDLKGAVVVHWWMRETPQDGTVDGRPADGAARNRFIDQNSTRDRNGLVWFVQDEIDCEDVLEMEGKRMCHGDWSPRWIWTGGDVSREERGGEKAEKRRPGEIHDWQRGSDGMNRYSTGSI